MKRRYHSPPSLQESDSSDEDSCILLFSDKPQQIQYDYHRKKVCTEQIESEKIMYTETSSSIFPSSSHEGTSNYSKKRQSDPVQKAMVDDVKMFLGKIHWTENEKEQLRNSVTNKEKSSKLKEDTSELEYSLRKELLTLKVANENLMQENDYKDQIKEAMQNQLDIQKETNSSLKKQLEVLKSSQAQSSDKEKTEFMQQKLELQEKVAGLMSKVNTLSEIQFKLEKTNSDLMSTLTELQETITHKNSEIKTLNIDLEGIKKEKTQLQCEKEKFEEDTHRLQKKVEDLEMENSGLLKEKEEARIIISDLQKEQSIANDLKMQLKNEKELGEILQTKVKEQDQEITKLRQNFDTLVEALVDEKMIKEKEKERMLVETTELRESSNQASIWDPADEFIDPIKEEKDEDQMAMLLDGNVELDDKITAEQVCNDSFPASQQNVIYITTVGTQTSSTLCDQFCVPDTRISSRKTAKKKGKKKMGRRLQQDNVDSKAASQQMLNELQLVEKECKEKEKDVDAVQMKTVLSLQCKGEKMMGQVEQVNEVVAEEPTTESVSQNEVEEVNCEPMDEMKQKKLIRKKRANVFSL